MADTKSQDTPDVNTVLGKHKNETVRAMWERVAGFAAPLAGLVDEIKASSPPPVNELDKELSESTDPKIVEFRAEIERLEAALRTAREDAHKELLKKVKTLSPEDLEKKKNTFAKHYNDARGAVALLRNTAAALDWKDVMEALDAYELPTLRGTNRIGTANSEGTPRPQVASIVVTRENGQRKEFDKLSFAAKFVGCETSAIYNAWIAAAEVSEWQKIDTTQEFDVNNCTVVITPKD